MQGGRNGRGSEGEREEMVTFKISLFNLMQLNSLMRPEMRDRKKDRAT